MLIVSWERGGVKDKTYQSAKAIVFMGFGNHSSRPFLGPLSSYES